MRLHALEIAAFGPFAGVERVDVDALAAGGLFLLHGPTGAGKTSVLDAVCFALYGALPGPRGSAGRLRSDHAPPALRTRVVLELTVRGRRLRVTREPAWERPKRRGTGRTSDPARTMMEELTGSGEWDVLSTRNEEAGHLLSGLVGMSAEQFCQVVLLPQGQFADFLRADAEARRPLLERLFDTSRFSAAEGWLAGQRREAEAAVRAAREEMGRLLARADQAAGHPPRDPPAGARESVSAGAVPRDPERADPGADGSGGEGAARVHRWLAESRERLAGTAAREAAAVAARVEARAALEVAVELERAQERWAAVQRRRTRRDAALPRRAELRRELDAARRAAPLGPLLELAEAASRTVAEAGAAEDTARADVLALPLVPWLIPVPAALAGSGPATPSGDTTAAVIGATAGTGRRVSGAPARALIGAEPSTGGRVSDVPAGALIGAEPSTGGPVSDVPARAWICPMPGVPADGTAAGARAGNSTAAGIVEAGVLRAAAQSARERAVHTEHDVEVEAELGAVVQTRLRARADADAAQSALVEIDTWLERERIARHALGTRAAFRPGAAAAVERAAAHLAEAEMRLAAGVRRDELDGRLLAIGAVLSAAIDAAQLARQDWLDLRQSRLDGMAAELAGRLAAGEPCVVCGSAEHPRPAAFAGARVSSADERAAEDAFQAAEISRTTCEHEVSALRAQRAAAAEAAGGEEELPALSAAHGAAKAILAAARRALRSAASASADLAAAEAAADEQRAARAEAAGAHATAEALAGSAAGQEETLRARLAGPPVGAAVLRGRIDALLRAAAALERLAGAREDSARSHDALAGSTARLRDAVSAAGFPGAAAARAAVRGDTRMRALGRELEALDAESREIDALLRDRGLIAAASAPPAPVGEATHRTEDADLEVSAAAAAATQAAGVVTQLEALTTRLDAAAAALEPALEHHRIVDGLSRLVDGTSGENAKRMRLSAYVLAARLEHVATAATARLLPMSGGRYSLVHCDASPGRARTGLGLRIIDAWTGQERETATLSGGESFTASLALALGLADVVTAEAGGPLIETLFVDEGFGSLDEETLEEVMDALDGLRAGGRVVGIVSHVADLRARIPAQLRVHKGRTGSTLAARHG